MLTKEYHFKKKLAETKDKEALIQSIELKKKAIYTEPMTVPILEKELTYLEEALKKPNLELLPLKKS